MVPEMNSLLPAARRSVPWLAASGAGVMAAGLTPAPGAIYGASVGVGLLGLLSSAQALRDEERAEMVAAATIAVDELIGRTGGARVRVGRWRGGWVGAPTAVRITYDATLAKADDWTPKVVSVVGRHLGLRYEKVSHSVRKREIKLRALPGQEVVEAAPRVVARVEKAVTTLMGSSARLTDHSVAAGELVAFAVAHNEPQRFAAGGARRRIETTISTMLPGRWRATWDLENDTAHFEVRPHLPESVWLPDRVPENVDDLLANYRKVRVPYAIDEDGREHVWEPAKLPQFLITGSTGSGKTSLTHALLGMITQYGWPVWVSDAKRVEFLGFRDWPNVQIVAGSVQEQVALIHRVSELMEYRYKLIESGQASAEDFEPLVVFLDEFAEFRAKLLEWYARIKVKGDPVKPPTLMEVNSLARLARTARIHLVTSLQRPDAEIVSGEGRDNYGQRVSIGRLSPNGALMMWENASTGVALPRGIIGRAMSMGSDARPVEVQCYRFPSMNAEPGSEEAARLEALRPARATHPRLVIIPPPETVWGVDSKGEPIETDPTFDDYVNAKWALMSEHPELDPLHASRQSAATSAQERRRMASTTTYLGLERDERDEGAVSSGVEPAAPVSAEEPIADPWVEPVGFDEFEGYGEPEPSEPWAVQVGDLLQDGDQWVVVDEEPVEDPADPSMVALSWRDDNDNAGSLAVDPSDLVFLRRPVDF